jgi:pilus assembly protein CpaF
MVTLCKRKYDMADSTLMDLVTEAFPIVVFAKQLENKQRRLMEIMDCEILRTAPGIPEPVPVPDYRKPCGDGKFIINGQHSAVQGISRSLQKALLENGMPQDTLKQILSMGGAA